MKTIFNTYQSTYLRGLLTMMVATFASVTMIAQSIVITDPSNLPNPYPSDTFSECIEASANDTLCFTTQFYDAAGMPATSLFIDAYSWTGPNGWTSTLASPCIPIDDVNYSGDYTVEATVNGSGTYSYTVTLDFSNTINWPDISTIFVTPDPNDPLCEKPFCFEGFTIESVSANCQAPAYYYCLELLDETGAVLASDVDAATNQLTNAAMSMSYGGGTAGSGTCNADLFMADLPFGSYELVITINQGDCTTGTAVAQQRVDVEVIESRNNLTCNDLVNITLANNCEGIIVPDMILEGDYCFRDFVIDLEHQASGTLYTGTGEAIINQAGLYTVTVTGASGLSCWGEILAEDKSIPELECDTVAIYCTEFESINPGDQIRGWDRAIWDATNANTAITLDAICGNITNIILNIEIDIDPVSDLLVELTSPTGTTITLLDLDDTAVLGNDICDGSNINVCLSDAGALDYSMFGSPEHCRETENAFIGSFQPLTAFSTFYSETAEDGGCGSGAGQDWTLNITSGSTYTLIEADLQVTTAEGTLLTSTEVVDNNGCSNAVAFDPEDDLVGTQCDNGYWETIERTWTATNEGSGLSATCVQVIHLKPFTVNEIIWPKSYDDLDQEALTCATAGTDTGMPTAPFASPGNEKICNLQITSSEIEFEICGPIASKKIITWSVLDWCTGDIADRTQVVKILDQEPLSVNYTGNEDEYPTVDEGSHIFKAYSDSDQCAGTWELVYPQDIVNPCDDDITWFVEYLVDDDEIRDDEPPADAFYETTNIEYENGLAVRITDLPVTRRTWVRFTATDQCGNSGFDIAEVDVCDNKKPNPVCIEFTVVAIGTDGCAYLPAESLNNNSWDNCGVVDEGVSRSANGPFEDKLEYCCGCMMDEEIVWLQVSDAAGNTNVCEVRVEVQNNMIPTASGGPANIDTTCTIGSMDLFSIAEAGKNEFNFMTNCPQNTTTFNVDYTTGDGSAIAQGDLFEPGACGQGTMTIKYVLTDQCGNEFPNSPYNQTLTFTNDLNGFDVTAWPQDADLTECEGMSDPESLPASQNANAIQFSSSQCNSDVAITYDDKLFPDVDDACFKILREWTVIDWCIVNGPGGSVALGSRTYTQVIKVDDNQPPVITNLNNLTGNDPSCQYYLTQDSLDYVLTDDCTEVDDIQISYELDGVPVGNIFDQWYPDGASITIVVSDHCDNVNQFNFRINTLDEEPPEAYCQSAVVTTINANGNAEVWVSDFSLGGRDNCDTQVDDFFRDELGSPTQVLTYDCDDVPNGVSADVVVTVYFADDSGNENSCDVVLTIQDTNDECLDDVGSRIAGQIRTEDFQTVNEVMVDLMQNEGMMRQMMTAGAGGYDFDELPKGQNYSVVPHRNHDYLNGVSTADLVQIQRHILGIQPLSSPYKLIAADVNNSGTVNGLDLVELRKLILGIYVELPQNDSWRFPIVDQQFADLNSPFPFKETIDASDLRSEMMDQDFVGVKIGDVNGSADPALKSGRLTYREAEGEALTLVVEDMGLMKGELVSVPFYAENMEDIVGFQSTMTFNPQVLEFVQVSPVGLDVNDGNIGLQSVNDGYITISWNDLEGVSMDSDRALFELQFYVKGNGNLSQQLFLSSTMTNSEAYGTDLKSRSIALNFLGGADEGEFVLYQNRPNPFADFTEVRFVLPSSSDVTFTVYDVQGREIYRKASNYESGDHTILLSKEELNSTGIMYYKLETTFGTATRKMIQLR